MMYPYEAHVLDPGEGKLHYFPFHVPLYIYNTAFIVQIQDYCSLKYLLLRGHWRVIICIGTSVPRVLQYKTW